MKRMREGMLFSEGGKNWTQNIVALSTRARERTTIWVTLILYFRVLLGIVWFCQGILANGEKYLTQNSVALSMSARETKTMREILTPYFKNALNKF